MLIATNPNILDTFSLLTISILSISFVGFGFFHANNHKHTSPATGFGPSHPISASDMSDNGFHHSSTFFPPTIGISIFSPPV